jgi:hypothetical protein
MNIIRPNIVFYEDLIHLLVAKKRGEDSRVPLINGIPSDTPVARVHTLDTLKCNVDNMAFTFIGAQQKRYAKAVLRPNWQHSEYSTRPCAVSIVHMCAANMYSWPLWTCTVLINAARR